MPDSEPDRTEKSKADKIDSYTVYNNNWSRDRATHFVAACVEILNTGTDEPDYRGRTV